jgi:hypothetical protein
MNIELYEPYLLNEDYEYIQSFIENAKNGIYAYQLLIITGEDPLRQDDEENDGLLHSIGIDITNGEYDAYDVYERRGNTPPSFEPQVKVVIIHEIESFRRKYREELKHAIQNKHIAFIAYTNHVEEIHKSLLEVCKIIRYF